MKRRTECCLNDADLCCSGVEPGECAPVIHDEARADNIGSAVDCTSLHLTSTPAHPNRPSQSTHHEGHLEQTAELVLVLHAGLWVNEAALVGDGAVGADEDVVGEPEEPPLLLLLPTVAVCEGAASDVGVAVVCSKTRMYLISKYALS